MQLGFGTLPAGYAPGALRTATVTLVDDDATLIVNFGTERHTTVKVRESDTVWHRFIFSLSTSRYGPPNGNPQQPVTIPLVVTHRGGTTTEDYEGIPSSVTFAVGESVTSFSMRAIPDGRKETGEGLRLDFGPLPAGVRAGTWGPYETIEFVDQELPRVTASFGAESYTATEGGAIYSIGQIMFANGLRVGRKAMLPRPRSGTGWPLGRASHCAEQPRGYVRLWAGRSSGRCRSGALVCDPALWPAGECF